MSEPPDGALFAGVLSGLFSVFFSAALACGFFSEAGFADSAFGLSERGFLACGFCDGCLSASLLLLLPPLLPEAGFSEAELSAFTALPLAFVSPLLERLLRRRRPRLELADF